MNNTTKREILINAIIMHDRKVYHPQWICNKIFEYMVPGYYCAMPMSADQCNTEIVIHMEGIYRYSFIRRKLVGFSQKVPTHKQIEYIVYDMTDKKDYGICCPCLDPQAAIDLIDSYFLGGYSTWSETLNLPKCKSINEKNIYIYEMLKLTYKKSLIRWRYKR